MSTDTHAWLPSLAAKALIWGIILGMAAKVGCSLFMTALTHAFLSARLDAAANPCLLRAAVPVVVAVADRSDPGGCGWFGGGLHGSQDGDAA